MPHLLTVWPSVASRLAASPRVLLLSDYDGTLSPIVARPELAVLPSETRQALAGLAAHHPRFRVGIVSGRGLSDLRERVDLHGIIYAGNHGLEITFPANLFPENSLLETSFTHPRAACLRPVLRNAAEELRERLHRHPGVIVEDKGLTLSVHYRQASPESVPEIRRDFDEVISAAPPEDVRVTQGKMVLEVRPNIQWGKGQAIGKIRETAERDALPIFFGDDLTDEEGFQVVQDASGIAVFVGSARQPTRAAYRVDSPGEVAETLRLLFNLLPRE